jgi:hypothetical protein
VDGGAVTARDAMVKGLMTFPSSVVVVEVPIS